MLKLLRCVARVAAISAVLAGIVLAQPAVEYRNRGNRFEGVRALPVSGYTIELLSARALYEEPSGVGGTPPVVHLRFFLDRPASAYLVVREVDNRHSYWLDQVKPVAPWRTGFDNVFEWPSNDVIGQLPGLRLDDLGVTVRVGNEHPSDLETVAPAILYRTAPPATIGSYEFAFKTNATARLEFSIERSDGRSVSPGPEPRALPKWSYGVPVRITWDATRAEPGEYRLKVAGRVLENNEKFAKEVRFYHQPRVR